MKKAKEMIDSWIAMCQRWTMVKLRLFIIETKKMKNKKMKKGKETKK